MQEQALGLEVAPLLEPSLAAPYDPREQVGVLHVTGIN
jgi:hypothetical protein